MSDWKRKELRDKKRRERDKKRISSEHELSGVRHKQPHRDKDISLDWHDSGDGVLHVTPNSIKIGGGIRISDEDWEEIFRDKDE
jgi:hypothetical protein